MEPIGLAMIYTFPVLITDVFERKLRKHISGAGAGALFSTDSAGWYIQINNTISIYLGMEEPRIAVGDKMTLKLERSQDASPAKL